MKRDFQKIIDRERLLLDRARAIPYRTLETGQHLSIHFYLPKDFKEGPARPVLLFFNGGAWDKGSVVQFAPHALYYVERGAVCGLVEYRNHGSHPGSRPVDALQDGIAAVSWVAENGERLHVDSGKLVVVGASAGANIAGCIAMGAVAPTARDGSEGGAGSLVEFRPGAAVLFSAIIDPRKGHYGHDRMSDAAEARLLSLSRLAGSGMSPILILHGTADRRVPQEEVAAFAARLAKKKCPCDYVEFEGRDENFFNLNVDPLSYEASLDEIDRFLDRQKILERAEDDEGPHLISWREKDY